MGIVRTYELEECEEELHPKSKYGGRGLDVERMWMARKGDIDLEMVGSGIFWVMLEVNIECVSP